uniref:Uncharacterized protein n=1 Tax=Amphimedon queenslandica TaxID=400682 RepID=A0A1X7TWP7_AMPQE
WSPWSTDHLDNGLNQEPMKEKGKEQGKPHPFNKMATSVKVALKKKLFTS